MDIETLKEQFINNTKEHVRLVNKYANKCNFSFPEHDNDKITCFLDAYYLTLKKDKVKNEEELLDLASFFHVICNEHHPEYFTDNKELRMLCKTYKRRDPSPDGPTKVSIMSLNGIVEMCADWCAMSEKNKNNPIEWAEENIPKRWIFEDSQKEYIYHYLDKMWNK